MSKGYEDNPVSYEWVKKQQRDEAEEAERMMALRRELGVVQKKKPQGWEKLKIKVAENPFVPIGVIATTAAVGFGLRAMVRGDRRMSNLMMRARIGCQAFAIVAIIVGFEMTRRRELEAAEQRMLEQPER